MDEATTPHERTRTIIDQIEVLAVVAARTMDLTVPVVEGSVTGCTMTWRNPSRRIVLSSRTARFNTAEMDMELDIRRPGTARRIVLQGANADSELLARPSDPRGSVLRLLSAIRTAAETLLTHDREAEEMAHLGMAMAIAEELGLPDKRWTLSVGSPVLGSGRISSSAERNVSTCRGTLPPTGIVLLAAGEACAMPIDAKDPGNPPLGSQAPLLCSVERPGVLIEFDRYGPETRLRALERHISGRSS